MTTDNRTNEPTPEQAEVALMTFRTALRLTEGDRQSADPVEAMQLRAMRAALVAAQGAAPVLPSSGNGPDRPDDSNYDEAISDSENFQEAIVAICEKYGVPVTNNVPRWQDGVYLRHAGDFVGEVKDAAERHLVIPALPSSGVDEDKVAEVERAAAARALEEAAIDTEGIKDAARDGMNKFGPYLWHAAEGVAEWLRARAAEIREGK